MNSQPLHLNKTKKIQKLLLGFLLVGAFYLFGFTAPAEAAIATGDASCSANSKTAGTSLACTVATAAIQVGNVAVLIFAGDNTATVDGNDGLLSSVTDSKGNSWVVERCFTNSRTAAAAGATTCIAKSKITTELAVSDTITANFSSITAKGIIVREFTVASGYTLQSVGTPQDDGRLIEPQSLSVSGLPAGNHLFFRSTALERATGGTWTVTPTGGGFTSAGCTGTTGGLNASNMDICGEYNISTSTSMTSDPTGTADDNASIFMAFEETRFELAGQVFFDAGIRSLTAAKTVKVAIGTSTVSVHSTSTDALGNWSIVLASTTSLRTGTPIQVWVDGDSNFKASTFTKLNSGTTSITDLDLYRNRVIVRDDVTIFGTSTTIAELAFYDGSDDSDIQYTTTGTTSITVASGAELYVAAGAFFAPEGPVTILGNASATSTDGSLYIAGTYAPRATTTLAGNLYLADTATLYPNPSGFVFNATTTHKYIHTYHGDTLGKLRFDGVGGSWAFTTSATTSSITIATGTLTIGGNKLVVYGDITQNGGFEHVGSDVEFKGFGRSLSGSLTGANAFDDVTVAAGDVYSVTDFAFSHLWIRSVAVDEVTGAIFVGSGDDTATTSSVYRCLSLSKGEADCDQFSDFTLVYTTAGLEVLDLHIDPVNRALYVGTTDTGKLFYCLLSTGCDASGDFSTAYDTTENFINVLVTDEINGTLYAGTGSGGIIYRCNLVTGCDAAADFTTAYDTTEANIKSLVIDYTNSTLYAGTSAGGIIYRCLLATGCDASGDFTTAYDTSLGSINDLIIDSQGSVLYVAADDIIYRCLFTTGCDASGDFTTAYDTTETGIYSLTIDREKDTLYAGGFGDLFACPLVTGCDAAGDFQNRTFSGITNTFYDLQVATNGALYIAEANLVKFIDTATTTLTVSSPLAVQNLTIGANATATLPTTLTVGDTYTNSGIVTGASTTTFTGLTAVATGTLTGVSAFGAVTIEGLANFKNGGATSTFSGTGVIKDSSAGDDYIATNVVDELALYTIGFCRSCGTLGSVQLVTYNKETGVELWSTTTDLSAGADIGNGISVDGTYVYITGNQGGSGGLGGQAIYLAAYNKTTGVRAWSVVNDVTAADDKGTAIAVDAKHLYMTGSCGSCGASSSEAFYTAKYDKSSGALLWASTTDKGNNSDYGFSIYSDVENIYVTGICTGCGSRALTAFHTIAYTKDTGALVWEKTKDPTILTDNARRITGDATQIYVTGACTGSGCDANGRALYTVAYNKLSGTEVWSTSTDPSVGTDEAYGLVVDEANVYLSGFCTSCGSVGSTTFYLAALNKATGEFVRSTTTDLTVGEDRSEALATDGQYLYVSGVCTACGTAGGEAQYTLKYEKDNFRLVDGQNRLTLSSNASTTNFTIATSSATTTNTVIAPTELSVSGNYSNQGTFTAGTGTTTFSGTSAQLLSGNLNTNFVSTSSFNNLVLTGAGSKKPLAPLAATGNFVVNSGATFLASSTLEVGRNFTQNGSYLSATTSSDWTVRSATGNDDFWASVTYGNSLFVAVGGGPERVMTSPDGTAWTNRFASGENDDWTSVTFGNGVFVAVGGTDTRVITSSNGTVWSDVSAVAGDNDSWNAVTYGNGLFVAVGSGPDRVITSTDGTNWTVRSAAGNDDYWAAVTYGNGLFVAVGGITDEVMTSPDGTNWTVRSAAGNDDSWTSVTYGNGLFVAVGSGPDRVITSTDGTNWTVRSAAGNDDSWTSVTYGNGLFVAVGSGPDRVITSTDGTNWTVRSAAGNDDSWTSVTYGNSLFVAVGNGPDRVMTAPELLPVILSGTSSQSVSGTLIGTNSIPELIFKNSGTKTLSSNASTTNVIIESGSGTVNAPTTMSIRGSYQNAGTFEAGSGTVILNGDSAQTATGTMTGTSAFNNLSVTNNTGTTTFGTALTVDSAFNARAGGTKLVFAAGATTTMATATITGSSTATTTIRSTASGTAARLAITTSYSISRIDVKDNNACGSVGGGISVVGATSTDSGNNTCWTFVAAGSPTVDLAENLEFYIGQATTTFGTVTVTDAVTPTITATNDLRLEIATTSTNFRFNTAVTSLTFGGTAAAKVSGTVSYENSGAVLVVNVTSNFAASDTLTISGAAVGNFVAVSTSTSKISLQNDGVSGGIPAASSTKNVRITGLLTASNHDLGQVTNQFDFMNQTAETLFAFKLVPTGESATTTDAVLTLSGVQGIEASELTNFKLYRDTNANAVYEVGDVLIDGAGILTLNGQQGAVTFSSDFSATTSANYIVIADTTSVDNDDAVVFSLQTTGLTTVGFTTLYQSEVLTTVSAIQHSRIRSGGGGGGSARIGGAPPEGIDRGGGGSGGGGGAGEEVDGANIAPDPESYRPTSTGAPDNQWTNPQNAYASDGSYATASTSTFRQTYTGFNIAIPTSNTIQGIRVKIDASGSTAAGTIDVGLSWDSGSSYTTAKATPTLSGTDVVYTVGGVGDTWGRSWSVSEFSGSTFRLRVTANPSSNTLRLDALEVQVYHQAGGGGSGGGGGI